MLQSDPAGAKGNEKRYSPAQCLGARKQVIEGQPDKSKVSTSYVERSNGTFTSSPFIRCTHNFVKISDAHKTSPAMAAGVTGKLWEMPDMVAMIEDWESAQPLEA